MSILFISHSNLDNTRALQVRDWLKAEGWGEVFLDLDPEQGLAPGQRWQQELKEAGERCAAVVALVSPHWLASRWCQVEYLVAVQLGKRLFGVILTPTPFADLPLELKAHFQLVDISDPAREEEGFARLRLGLKRAGLHPEDFPWPPPKEPRRSPYRGLGALEEQDAAIFFGREGSITKGLDALRRLRGGAPERMLMVFGPSGTGKSSFLKAGLLARLRRDEENFLVLPTVRPERAALSGPRGLLRALGLATLPSAETRGEVLPAHLAALRAPILERLDRLAAAARETYNHQAPTLILPIDQSEELFAADQPETAATLELLVALFGADPNLLVILTIRSDSISLLQNAKPLAEVGRLPFELPALSSTVWASVIEGPGKLADPPLVVEPALTERLGQDLDRADALPLLGFTLERLAGDFARDGKLGLKEYEQGLGGLGGAIEKAANAALEAARQDPQLAPSPVVLESLARRAFIPWLVRVDEQEAPPKRRVALLSELPIEVHGLVGHLVNQRLLVQDEQEGVPKLEVSHEAVLRHWQALSGWIAEEREDLRTLETVLAAAQEWLTHRNAVAEDGAGEGQVEGQSESWLAHRGFRLTAAEKVSQREDYSRRLGQDGHAYLAACRVAENSEREKEQLRLERQRRLQRRIFGWQLVALLILLVGGWQLIQGRRELSRQKSSLLASGAQTAFEAGFYDSALRLALVASRESFITPASVDAGIQLGRAAHLSGLRALLKSHEDARLPGHEDAVLAAAFSPDGSQILTSTREGRVRIWTRGKDGLLSAEELEDANSAHFSPQGTWLVATSKSGQFLRIWNRDAKGRWIQGEQLAYQEEVGLVEFSADGGHFVTTSNATAWLWSRNAAGGWQSVALQGRRNITGVAILDGGKSVATADIDGTFTRFGIESGNSSELLSKQWSAKVDSYILDHSGLVAVHFVGGTFPLRPPGSIWREELESSDLDPLKLASFFPASRLFIAESDGKASVLSRNENGVWQTTDLKGNQGEVSLARFSADGTQVLALSDDGAVCLWSERAGEWTYHCIGRHRAEVLSARFSPDGDWVLTASADGTVGVWRTRPEAEPTFLNHRDRVVSAAISKHGKFVVTGSQEGEVRLFERSERGTWTSASLKGHRDMVDLAMLSPDGASVLTGSNDHTARLWNRDMDGTWKSVELEGHTASLTSALFTPDGSQIVTTSLDGTARLWNQTGPRSWRSLILESVEGGGLQATLTQNGAKLFLSSQNRKTWAVNTRMLQRRQGKWIEATCKELEVLEERIPRAFSPDGKIIVTGAWAWLLAWSQNSAGVWRSQILRGHEYLGSVTFSPDSSRLFAGSIDGTAEVWSRRQDGAWESISLEGDASESAAFSPDGRYVVTASGGETAQIWDLRWLMGPEDWAKNEPLSLPETVCREKLHGSLVTVVDPQTGQQVERIAERLLTKDDVLTAPILAGREGEDVCAPFVDPQPWWAWLAFWR